MSARITFPVGRLLSVLCLALSVVPAPAFCANIVKNGSFENILGLTKTFTIGKPDGVRFKDVVEDWTLDLSNPFLRDTLACLNFQAANPVCPTQPVWEHPGASPDGGNIIAIDSDVLVSKPLSQVIEGLMIGQTYTLSFFQAAGQLTDRTGATTDQWEVTFGDETQVSTLMSVASKGKHDWMQETMSFTATNTTQTLTFYALGTPSGLPPFIFLDGVSMEADGPEVPEPSAFGLIGLGLLSVPILNRIRVRRRK